MSVTAKLHVWYSTHMQRGKAYQTDPKTYVLFIELHDEFKVSE